MTKLSNKVLWSYGFGNFGFGLIFQILATYFVFYATAVLGLSGTLVGTIVGIGIVWDAVSDPIMGYISDNTTHPKYGRRHLYLWVGGIVIAFSNLLIWNLHLGFPKWLQVPIMVVMLLIIKTGMTIYGTPYTALGAELTHDHNQRLKIQSIKMIFFMLGIGFAAAGCMLLFFSPTEHYPIGQLNPKSYQYMSVVTTMLMIGSMYVVFKNTKACIRVSEIKKDDNGIKNFFISMKKAFNHSDLRAVVLGYLFTNIASAILSTIGLHVYTYTFKMNNTEIAIIAGLQLFIAILSQGLWINLNKVIDKAQAIKIALGLSVSSFVFFIISVLYMDFTATNLWALAPFMLLGGIGSGGLITLPQAMVADTGDANAILTGKRQEGVYYGTLTLTYKLSQSIAIIIIGYVLDLIGFNADLEFQSAFTLTGLGLVLGIGSLIALFLSYLSYRHYKLSREKMDAIQAQLAL